MYRILREYECGICFKKEIVNLNFYECVVRDNYLPFGWRGGDAENEVCFCRECSEAIKKLKENQS